jgi:hypothetical protein
MPLTLDGLVKSTIEFKATRAKPPKISVSRFVMTAFYQEKDAGLLQRTWKKITKAISSKISKFFTGKEPTDADEQKKEYVGTVMVKSVAKSEVGAGNYNTFLQAKDISISSEKDKTHRTQLSDGAYMGSIDYRKTEVKVRCDCPDFRWRFAYYNDLKQALYGLRPPPYKRKTNRPPVNPRHLPGMCKHLFNVVKILSSRGVIR